MAPIDDAIEYLKSLQPGEEINYTQIANKYRVDRSTLARRWQGKEGPIESKIKKTRLLNNAQETKLIKYIETLVERGLPPRQEIIRNFASEIATKEARKN